MAKPEPARPEEAKIYRTVADVAPELWADAAARPAEEAARSSGALYDPNSGFTLTYMGGAYQVDLTRRQVTGPAGHRVPGFQKALVLLAYLAHAQDLGQAGRLVPARDLNGGAMFFTGPHTLLTSPVTNKFGGDPEGFLKKAATLGLTSKQSGSGYFCHGLVLPNLTIGCTLHPEDEEFTAELTYLFDAYAHYHLPLDAIFALVNILAEELAS